MGKLRRVLNEIAFSNRKHFYELPPLQRSLIPFLSLASFFFKYAIFLRRSLYRCGIFCQQRLPVPVISVGNLTWGGNGKTPMVEFLGLWLIEAGISPLILSRGYAGGDEANMLRRRLAGKPIKIGVGANRADTAAYFFERYGYVSSHISGWDGRSHIDQKLEGHDVAEKVGAVILDDGMQHWRLWRDLEIVMVNGLSPWGNRYLIPRGPLREPINALNRADIVVVHHADLVLDQNLRDIESVMQKVKESLPVFFSRMAPSHFFKVGNISSKIPLSAIKNAVILCVSAIGSANAFVEGMTKLGALHVDRVDFSDHHLFQTRDIDCIKSRLTELEDIYGSKAIAVVTEKDYDRDPEILKQLNPYEVFVLCSEFQIMPRKGCSEDGFKKLLKELL